MSKPILTFSVTNPYFVKVTHGNSVVVGDIVRNTDDNWRFWPNKDIIGAWNVWVLQEIVTKLFELNENTGEIV